MGCIVGKAQSGVVAENGNTGRSNRTQFEEELSSYKAACRLDPELRSFDAAVQVRTSRIISCLREGVVFRSLSINSLREVTIGLLDVNQSALNNIIELKEDILKNPDLLALVRDYFENCLETLTLFTVLGECLDKARDGEIMIHRAFQCFEEEKQSGNSGGYLGTLGALKDFKAAGDPFKKFAEEFPLVRRKQEAMLEKLRIRESKLDEKLKSSKAWRKVSSIIFVVAFTAVFICAVVFAAVAAPPAATSAVAVVTGSMEPVGAWLNSMWNNYERALKGEHEVIKWMHENTNFAVADFHGIRILVDRLEVRINSLEQNADFAVEKEGEEDEDAAVKVGMEEIKKKMEELMRSVEDLGKQVDHCSLDVRKTADFVLRNIRDEA